MPKKSCTVKTAAARPRVVSARRTQTKVNYSELTIGARARLLSRTAPWCAMGLSLLLTLGLMDRGVQAAYSVHTPRPASVLVSELPAPPPPPSERERLEVAVGHLDVTPDLARSELQSLFLEAQHADVLVDVASTLVEQDSAGFPGGTQGDFLRALAPSVLLASRDSAVPPSVTLAQAILESGWGRSSLARDANNLFGVKAQSHEPSVRLTGGSRYRAYGSWEESLRDHNSLLTTSPRYAAAQAHLDDWEAFLRALAPVYASSHAYVRQISGLVERYRLDRWDPLIRQVVGARSS